MSSHLFPNPPWNGHASHLPLPSCPDRTSSVLLSQQAYLSRRGLASNSSRIPRRVSKTKYTRQSSHGWSIGLTLLTTLVLTIACFNLPSLRWTLVVYYRALTKRLFWIKLEWCCPWNRMETLDVSSPRLLTHTIQYTYRETLISHVITEPLLVSLSVRHASS